MAEKISFILAGTDNGVMIVNRNDFHVREDGLSFGVGGQLLETGSYDAGEIDVLCRLLKLRHHYHSGEYIVAVDVGANIGTHTIAFAKTMRGWGKVLAFEPQRPLYYALCGNVVLNNLHGNVDARCRAVGALPGFIDMPVLDYDTPASYGSLSLCKTDDIEIGQNPYARCLIDVTELDIFARADLIKVDVEGMELEVLRGASERLIDIWKPILFVEKLRCDAAVVRQWMEGFGYVVFEAGLNFLAVHESDPCLKHVLEKNLEAEAA